MEFQEKRKVKKFMYSKVTLVVLVILTVLILKAVWSVYQKQQFTKDNLNKTASDYNNLKEREERLSREINWLKTENGIEQEIREKYGLVKPGEEVIVIVDKDNVDDGANIPSESLWQKILIWLR